MREALDTRTMEFPPTLDEIVDRLGAFSSASDGTEEGDAPSRRPRRRRRADKATSCCGNG